MTIADNQRVPLVGKRGDGRFALVDSEDVDRVLSAGQWGVDHKGYVRRSVYRAGRNPKTVRLHRFVLGLVGPHPFVDHLDGDPLNCRRANLRLASNAENMQNMHAVLGDVPVRGVGRYGEVFRARATLLGKTHHLGYFDTVDEAERVVVDWRARNMPFSREAVTA